MKPLRALGGLVALAAFTACRLVAGIEDIQLTSDAGTPGTLPSVVFTRGNETVDEVISDGQYVYARTISGILRCPVAGCGSTPDLLVNLGGASTVSDMALVGNDLYYALAGTSVDLDGGNPLPANDGAIHVVGKDGKNDRVYRSGLVDPVALGADAANLYWLDDPNGLAATGTATAWRCPLGTCAAPQAMITGLDTTVVFGSDANFFVRGAELFAFAADGASQTLYACSTAAPCGATPKKFATALDANDLFFADAARIFYLTPTGDVGYLDATGTKKVLVGGQASPTSIVVDASFVYFTVSTTGTVLRVPNTGSQATPAPVATQQPSVTGLTEDAVNVYWIIETGAGGSTVMRLAK